MTMVKDTGQKNYNSVRIWVREKIVSSVKGIISSAMALGDIYAPDVFEALLKDFGINAVQLCNLTDNPAFNEWAKPNIDSEIAPPKQVENTNNNSSTINNTVSSTGTIEELIIGFLRISNDFVKCTVLYDRCRRTRTKDGKNIENKDILKSIKSLIQNGTIIQKGAKKGAMYKIKGEL